jgi:hypothetical protein
MLKLKKSSSERLPPLVLHFEDVENIYRILEEINPDVRISTADYAFDNLEELKQAGIDKTNYLTMHINDPGISIKLEPYSASLQGDEQSQDAKEAIDKIRKILLRRTQYISRFLQSGLLAGFWIGFSCYYLIPGITRNDATKIEIGAGILLLGLIWSWWALIKSHTVYPTIYLSTK